MWKVNNPFGGGTSLARLCMFESAIGVFGSVRSGCITNLKFRGRPLLRSSFGQKLELGFAGDLLSALMQILFRILLIKDYLFHCCQKILILSFINL